MGADRRPKDGNRTKAVPLASLPLAQRMLVTALIEAGKAAAIRGGVGVDSKTAESAFRPKANIHAMARTAAAQERAAELHVRPSERRLRRERLR